MSTFTLTQRWRAKWWKIPWLVLRRRPYRYEVTYYDCEVTSVAHHRDGSVSMDFVAGGSVTSSDLRTVRT